MDFKRISAFGQIVCCIQIDMVSSSTRQVFFCLNTRTDRLQAPRTRLSLQTDAKNRYCPVNEVYVIPGPRLSQFAVAKSKVTKQQNAVVCHVYELNIKGSQKFKDNEKRSRISLKCFFCLTLPNLKHVHQRILRICLP